MFALIAFAITVFITGVAEVFRTAHHRSETNLPYDKPFNFSCNDYEHLSGILDSEWSGHHKDRKFNFECQKGFVTTECKWSNKKGAYVNNWDGDLKYECPSDSLITGLESEHNDWFEDRRWNFKCCKVYKIGIRYE